MHTAVPPIYSPRLPAATLDTSHRAICWLVVLGCAAVLGVAWWLEPNPAGVGTHTAIGLQRCQFLQRSGVPCPSCGMTTSFSFFAHGNLLASFYVQPLGMVLAMTTCAVFWIALYMGVTGKPVLRLLRWTAWRYHLLAFMLFAIAAWGWKIWIHVRGIDGWK